MIDWFQQIPTEMAAEKELERAIFPLLSLLCEMERHHLTDNINMCGLFARRGEDFVGLPRVCASLFALQSNVTALTQEVQELIGLWRVMFFILKQDKNFSRKV